MNKDLNVRRETIKFPEENIDDKLLDRGLSDDFFGFDTKNKGNNGKNKQVWLHQTKISAQERNLSTKWKGNLTNERKDFQIVYLTRGYYPEYMKNSYISKPNNLIQKWAEDLSIRKWHMDGQYEKVLNITNY